jgi:hypothetical protein
MPIHRVMVSYYVLLITSDSEPRVRDKRILKHNTMKRKVSIFPTMLTINIRSNDCVCREMLHQKSSCCVYVCMYIERTTMCEIISIWMWKVKTPGIFGLDIYTYLHETQSNVC